MAQRRIPAAYIRGGTSRAVVLHRKHLPKDSGEWPVLLLAMMGSPDHYERQLDGMGGGISSLSKVCIVGPPSREDADIDYTFAQVSVTGHQVDFSGNCGNMSSAIGPFAVDEGLVERSDGPVCVRIHNTNSGRIILSQFEVVDGEAVVTGDMLLPGVSAPGAPIQLDFLDPAGTCGRGLLPAGECVVELEDNGDIIAASPVDAAIPCVFIDAAALGLDPAILPDALEINTSALARLERLRLEASVSMGIAETREAAAEIIALPKVAIVGAACDYTTISGEAVAAADYDVSVRMISTGRPHRAIPITGSLAVACAAGVSGTRVAACIRNAVDLGALRIGTPSGVVLAGVDVEEAPGEVPKVRSARVYRTQRRLMEGSVCVPV